jgi:hypothetical protein
MVEGRCNPAVRLLRTLSLGLATWQSDASPQGHYGICIGDEISERHGTCGSEYSLGQPLHAQESVMSILVEAI